MVKPRTTEVDAYVFIKNELKALGWNIKNPERFADGQVYTQNECLGNSEIKKYLGAERPENIIKIKETTLWVIEAKKEHSQLNLALQEAKDYANKINKSNIIQAKIVSGVAGNEGDSYLIKSAYFNGSKYVPITINEKEITGLLDVITADNIIETNNSIIKDFQINENLFLKKAEEINKTLHLGGINKNNRAKVMSALLLSLVDDTEPNLNATPIVLIGDINSRVLNVLDTYGKKEFYDFISIDLPTNKENHFKYKQAIVKTLQELKILNIRSAMNSGTDVLGKFYEVFLKYGNGAKEIGIVLTPRHITRFIVDVLNIGLNDFVLDVACGTGGFLVASFDQVKKISTPKQLGKFKENNLFGIEDKPEIVSLALINMIFRGDGRNNIVEKDCFNTYLIPGEKDNVITGIYSNEESKEKIITKVLMNPPFALKKQDEKEYKFINHGLKQMVDGGILFSVLPYSCLVKGSKFLEWRNELLKENTLLSVISFPKDLFYPVGIITCGIFIKKGIPHPKEQNVLWLRLLNDGLLKKKGKRLPNIKAQNDFEIIHDTLQLFIQNPTIKVQNIVQFQKAERIDFNDIMFELTPEVYLDEKVPTQLDITNRLENKCREAISFMIKYKKEIELNENIANLLNVNTKYKLTPRFQEISISKLFKIPINTGDYHVSSDMDNGDIPLISTSSTDNGIEKFVNVRATEKNAITIACDGAPLSSYYHYYPFVAKDNVLICNPNTPYKFTTLLYIISELESLKWRFSWGRKCYKQKAGKIKIFLPLDKNNKIDEDFIENEVKSLAVWKIIDNLFNNTNNFINEKT